MKGSNDGNFSFFGGLDKILNMVTDMIENDKDEKNIEGTIRNDEHKIAGKYGINIKLGQDTAHNAEKLKTFSGAFSRRDEPKTEEPVTDIYDEKDKVTIIAQLPGVRAEDIELSVDGDKVTIIAPKNGLCYKKSLMLGFISDGRDIKESFNNSIYCAVIPK